MKPGQSKIRVGASEGPEKCDVFVRVLGHSEFLERQDSHEGKETVLGA
jgi:hypothetical protein